MSPECEHQFLQLVFASVLSFQYHPKNFVPPERDEEVIRRALKIADLSLTRYYEFFGATRDKF